MKIDMFREDVKFAEYAMRVMENDPTCIHVSNEDETLLALRWGFSNDCIRIFRSEEIMFLHNCIQPVNLKTTFERPGEEI